MTTEVSVDITSRQGAWHQSGLDQLLDDCPRKWALSYQLGLPTPATPATLGGRAFHAAVESWLDAHQAGTDLPDIVQMGRLAKEYVEAAYAELRPHHRAATPLNDLLLEVTACIANWWTAPVKELDGVTLQARLASLEVLAVEGHYRAPLPGAEDCLPIGGTFDLLAFDPSVGRVLLIDHKTVKDNSSAVKRWKDGGKGVDQATMYAVLCALNPDIADVSWGDWPVTEFHVVRKRASNHKSFVGALAVTQQPTDADVSTLVRRVHEAEAALAAGVFPRNPASNLCRANWCPHFEGCQGTGELAQPWHTLAA
jgi:hypothetical protein